MFRNLTVSTWLLAALIIATLGFGMWGWLSQANALNLSFGDALYHTIGSFILTDVYLESTSWNSDWRIDVARWSGLAAFFLGAAKAIMALLAQRLQHFWARRRKGHFILIGDDAFASILAKAALAKGKQVTWLAASEAQAAEFKQRLFILHGAWDITQAEQFGLKHASSVVIATRDDASAIACAQQIQKKAPNKSSQKIFVSVRSSWLAMRIDELDGISGIRMFSQAQAAIRKTHRKHPPFLVAKKHEHKRIHTVIFGFGLYGEAVLVDSLLSSLTTYLGKPRITIVDPLADAIKSSLALRYPELEKTVNINIVKGALEGKENCLSKEDILSIGSQDPVTITYICLPNETKSITTALAIQSLAHREDWTEGPIFIRLSANEAVPSAKAGVSELKSAQLLSFGSLNDLVADTDIFDDNVDALARKMHEAYQNAAPKGKTANVAWNELSKDIRDANRRQFMHIPAKLSSAGIDLETWLRSLDKNPKQSHLPQVNNILGDKYLIEKLAKLEHERWMADRRINGWRQGKTRNNQKRLHPDLVPYSELSEKAKSYDRIMIETFGKILQSEK